MNDNKTILTEANAAITRGDYEGFLSYCTEDTEWIFVGEQTLRGKEAVRRYMAEAYKEPPAFSVSGLIGEGDYVTALGTIAIPNAAGVKEDWDYCDVWRFREGKMAGLKAFVIRPAESISGIA